MLHVINYFIYLNYHIKVNNLNNLKNGLNFKKPATNDEKINGKIINFKTCMKISP
jgi:hypothetical protein